MALAHDKDGFLTGQPANIDTASYARHLALLREIREDGKAMRTDIAAIRKSLSGPAPAVALPAVPVVALPSTGAGAANEPRIRQVGKPVAARTSTATASPAAASALPAANRQRNARPSGDREASPVPANARTAVPRRADGRFVSRGGEAPADSPKAERDARDAREANTTFKDAASDLSRGASDMLAGAEQVDPTLAAAKEVKEIVSPALGLLKPLGRFFRRRPGASDAEKAVDKTVPWYRRMLNELRDINKKSGGGAGGGILGKLAGLFMPLLGLLGGRGVGGLIGKGLGGMLGAGGGLLGKLGKGALRRIPILGALLAGGSALASLFGSDDPSKSPAQNRADRFGGVGGGVGALVGGAVGTLLGPIGTIVGATLGDIVGTKVGTWLSTVDWSDVGRTITGTWSEAATWIKGAFEGAANFVTDSWAKLTDQGSKVFSAVSDWFNEKLGIAKTALNTAATSVRDAAGRVAEGARSAVNSAREKVSAAKEAAVIQGGRMLGSLNKGYRHRESFDGIAGGASLQKFGTYTNDEADRIRTLKAGGYNTSANLPGGMSASTRTKIEKAAIEAGHDPKEMLKIAAMESGGNPNAISSTGAIGTFQFTGQTATGVGITNRFDEDQNIAGGMRLATQNKAALQKAGLPATAENLYMMHQLGPKAAFEVISGAKGGKSISELSASTQDGVRKNFGAKSVTAADYIGTNRKALDDRFARVVGTGAVSAPVASPSSSAPTVASVMAPIPQVPKVIAPISVSAKPVSYTPAAPDLMKYAPKEAPPTTTPIGSNQKGTNTPMRIETPLTQNLGDRSIAAVATGGIGMQQLRV